MANYVSSSILLLISHLALVFIYSFIAFAFVCVIENENLHRRHSVKDNHFFLFTLEELVVECSNTIHRFLIKKKYFIYKKRKKD